MKENKKIKCEIYRDSMQNYKKYGIRPAQLIIADVPYNVGKNFMAVIPCGTRMEIVKTEKASLQENPLLIVTSISIYMNTSIFVPRC